MNQKKKDPEGRVTYPVNVVGRHVEVTEAMKSYALEKLSKIDKYSERVLEASITMDIQKLSHSVDYVLDINNLKVKVSATTDNMYSAIDKAIDRLERQLRRYIHKIHAHHTKHDKRGIPEMELEENVIRFIDPLEDVNDQIEEENLKEVEHQFEPPEIVSQERSSLKMLTTEEALWHLDISGKNFMLFKSEEEMAIKLIYRREDGHYGVITVENPS